MRQGKDLRLAGGQKLFHREFRRGVQPRLGGRAVGRRQGSAKSVQMGLVAGRGLESGGVDLNKAVGVEPAPHEARDAGPREQPLPPCCVAIAGPERRGGDPTHGTCGTSRPAASPLLAFAAETGIRRASIANPQLEKARPSAQDLRTPDSEDRDVKVIASAIRKGNIIEREDGQLCVVLSAESFHPGKGTPTTQIDMRRLSDGVKVTDRYKTTEQVERAFVEDKSFDFLYSDGDGHHFMNAETYDQLTVPGDVIGDQAQWLQEGMKVILSLFNETPVAIRRPPRVTLEIIET